MTNYSRTTLRELKKRYLNILKKCLLANLMMFAFSLPAHSGTATDADSLMVELEKNERTVVESGTYTLTYDKPNVLYDAESDSIIFPNIEISQSGSLSGGRLYTNGNITFNSSLKLVFKKNETESLSNQINGGVIRNLGTMTFNSEVDFLDNKSDSKAFNNGSVIYNKGTMDFKKHVNFKNNIATSSGHTAVGVSIYNEGGAMTFTSADFMNNQSGSEEIPKGQPSAIYNNNGGKITFTGIVNFKDNQAYGSGGLESGVIWNRGAGSNITFLGKTTFENNKAEIVTGTAQAFGGAIENGRAGGGNEGALIEFSDVNFVGNRVIGTKSGAGGAVFNANDAVFNGKTLFQSNIAEGKLGNAVGGAVYNDSATNESANILFKGDALFQNSIAEGKNSQGAGGAIGNIKGTIIFEGKADFINNTAIGWNGNARGSAIYNSGGTIIFKEKVTFLNNITKGTALSLGTLDVRGSNGNVTFENGFHFDGSKAIVMTIADGKMITESETHNDIYMADGIINIEGTDPNAEEYIGGGIKGGDGLGTINKSSVATLVFGEESDSTGFTGVFNQTAGKTVARSETFLGGTNNILGGELETHGNEINYTAIVGQNKDETTGEVLSSGTLTHFAMGETPVEIKGLSFKEEGTNLSMSFKNGRYQLNSDVENSFGNKLMFENSVLAIKDGTNISGTVVATKSAIDVGVGEISVDNIDLKENSTLQLGVNSLTEHGKVNGVVTGTESSEIALTLGLEVEKGVYQLFDRDNEVSMKENSIFNITDLKNGSYEISKKTSNELSSSLKVGKNEGKTLSAIMEKEGSHQAFKRMQTEVLSALQSNEGTSMQKAKKALSAVGSKEHPIEQSVSSEHLVALQNVVQAELHGSTVGHSGGEEEARAKVYIKGLYDRTKSSMGEGFRARSKGAVLGVQSEVTDTLTLGVGYATSQTTAKEDLRRTEVDTNTGFISAHYQPNAWWVSGLATFSRGEYEEEKQILSSMGKATYDVDSWGAQVMTGYDIKLDNAIITPEVGMRYLSVKQEGYTDTLGTTVSGTRSDYLTALVGVKGTWDMGAIRPTAGVTVGYDVISDDVSALNTLANGASYTVNGEALDRLSTGVSLGVEADLGERTTLKLEYSGTFRKEYQDHSGMLKLEMKF